MTIGLKEEDYEMSLVRVQLKVAGKGRLQVPGGLYKTTTANRLEREEKEKEGTKPVMVKSEVR